jgi:hypothetical protein
MWQAEQVHPQLDATTTRSVYFPTHSDTDVTAAEHAPRHSDTTTRLQQRGQIALHLGMVIQLYLDQTLVHLDIKILQAEMIPLLLDIRAMLLEKMHRRQEAIHLH